MAGRVSVVGKGVVAVAFAMGLIGSACGGDSSVAAGIGDVDVGAVGVAAEGVQDQELDQGTQRATSVGGGSGTGTVEVNGVTYTVETDFCYDSGGDFSVVGPGRGSDGSDAFVSIYRGYDSREELMEIFEGQPDYVESLLQGNDAVDYVTVDIEVGVATLDDPAPDNRPSWGASSQVGVNEINYTVRTGSLTGEGMMNDDNEVVLENYEDQLPFTFSASCS